MEDTTEQNKPRTDDIKITECIDFSALMLSEPVLSGLKQAGFERPSPIQLKAIPLGRCGLDLVVQAKSGTGKTCVFSVIALENVVTDMTNTQVLILAPTREIAVQIWEVINSLGSDMPALRCYTFIGGLPLNDDKAKLKKCHIAVGTPGRVKQLIEHQSLITESVRLFVLDEADKLLEEGFQETINWIYSSLPENKQMLALSATYPEALAQHLTAYMRDPTFVRLNTLDPALLGIRQFYKQVPFHPLPQKAFEARCQELMCLLSTVSFQQCLVFSNYQLRAQSLSDVLNSKGWPAAYISGSQDQQDRLIAMAKLKKFKCRILISTDLTSRGIDAENVNLVVNMDIPYDHETYLHRIGRAGRFGTYGAAVTFVSLGKEMADLKSIEKKANTRIPVLPDPVPSDLTRSSGYVDLDEYVITEQLHSASAIPATDEPSNQQTSATDEPSNQQTSATDTPSNQQTSATDTPSNQKTSATDTTSNQQTSATDTPSNQKTSATDTTSNQQTSATDTPSNQKTSATDTHSNQQTSATDTPSNQQTSATDTPSNQQTSATDEASNHQTSATDTPSNQQTSATDEARNHQTSATTPATDTPRNHQTSAITPATDTPSNHQTSATTPATDTPSNHQTSAITPATDTPSNHQTSAITPATDTPSNHQTSATTPATDTPSNQQTSATTPATDTPSNQQTSATPGPKTSSDSSNGDKMIHKLEEENTNKMQDTRCENHVISEHKTVDNLEMNDSHSTGTSEQEPSQNERSQMASEIGAHLNGSIPDLIDSISENVQTGYKEAEILLEMDSSEVDGVEDAPQSPVLSDGDTAAAENQGDKDAGDAAEVIQSFILPFAFKRSSPKPPQQSKTITESQPDSAVGTSSCSESTANDDSADTNSSKESGQNTDCDNTQVMALHRVLQAKIKQDSVDMKPLDFTPPMIVDLSQWKPTVKTSLNEITSDLKHFRETGQILPKENPDHDVWKSILQSKKEFFEQALPCVENYLRNLHLDPSNDICGDHSDQRSSSVRSPVPPKDRSEANVVNHKYDKSPRTTTKQPSEKQSLQDSCGDESSEFVGKERTPQTFKGARPKEHKDKELSNPSKHKSVSRGNPQKEKTPKACHISDEDRLLGLEYMKKLTACTDKDHSSDTMLESDTTETEHTTSDDEDWEDEWEVEEDNEADWEEEEEEGEDGNGDYYYEQDVYQEEVHGEQVHDHHGDAMGQESWYNSPEYYGFNEHYSIGTKRQHKSQPQPQAHTHHHQNGYGGEGTAWNSNHYGASAMPSSASSAPHYPHHLWLQCTHIMNSMGAMQSAQYAWWCQQQYEYHMHYARQYQSMYTNQKRTEQMQDELNRLKAQMSKLCSKNESQL